MSCALMHLVACMLHALCTIGQKPGHNCQGVSDSAVFFSCSLLKQLGLSMFFENCLKPRILSSSLWNFKYQYQKKERRRKFRKSCFNNFPAWGKLQRNQQTASWLFTFAGSIYCCINQHGLNQDALQSQAHKI